MVGLGVLFLRLEDPNAWLLALLFGSWSGAAGFPDFRGLGPSLRPFAMVCKAIFVSWLAAFFYFFFAVFPARSPRRPKRPIGPTSGSEPVPSPAVGSLKQYPSGNRRPHKTRVFPIDWDRPPARQLEGDGCSVYIGG